MSKGEHTKKNGRTRAAILISVGLVMLAVFLVSGFMVISQVVRDKRENDAFWELAQRVPERPAMPSRRTSPTEPPEPTDPDKPTEATPPPTEPPTEPPIPTPAELYGELFAENEDMFGWVSVEGTRINYPVMHTPDDPEYYLRRAFDKSSAYSGTPFLDYRCYPGCGNYIIYGHHMKNGTMFADLPDYSSRDFWLEHPIIHFDTLEEYGDYEVLAAFYSRVYTVVEENVFRYYEYTDLTQEEVFDEFMRYVHAAALYDTGVEAHFGDQLLTLSTCSYHTDEGRFVVVARKIPE